MEAATLDLWHTLIYLAPDAEEAYMRDQVMLAANELAASPRSPDAGELSYDEIAKVFETVYAEAVREAGQGRTVTPVEQFRRTAERAGRVPDVDRYLRRLGHLVESLPLGMAPGALEFLRRLNNEGYRLAMISNTVGEPGAALRPILTRMGFDPYFREYVFSDEHPWTKPSPEIFWAALRPLGSTPAEAVHVGDAWSDLEGARRAGFRAAVLFTGLHDYGKRYRELFALQDSARQQAALSAGNLEDVARLVESVLPPPRG